MSAELDEVLNSAKDLVREMEVMNLEPNDPTREMVGLLAEAVGHLADAFAYLGSGARRRNRSRRRRDQEPAANRARVPRRDVGAAGARRRGDVFTWREVYRRLSRIGDLVHTVAERVWYSVVKEA